jgi:hypothetical protein
MGSGCGEESLSDAGALPPEASVVDAGPDAAPTPPSEPEQADGGRGKGKKNKRDD